MLVQVAINGRRLIEEHPQVPTTPEAMAAASKAAVAAGAGAIHFHARNENGEESLAAADVARALTAIRAACPGIPVGVSTGEWMVPDPHERLAIIQQWTVYPDFVSVNFIEKGSVPIAEWFLSQRIGVEAGLQNWEATHNYLDSGLKNRCLRILFEPLEQDRQELEEDIGMMEFALTEQHSRVPRLLHGFDGTVWTLMRQAWSYDYDTRVGLEDGLTLPDGSQAADNAALVTAAMKILRLPVPAPPSG
jgi:uncharacterized protein (DUF849 family)